MDTADGSQSAGRETGPKTRSKEDQGPEEPLALNTKGDFGASLAPTFHLAFFSQPLPVPADRGPSFLFNTLIYLSFHYSMMGDSLMERQRLNAYGAPKVERSL